jgi:hypothetical protein
MSAAHVIDGVLTHLFRQGIDLGAPEASLMEEGV